MFDIGFSEILMVGVVALVVFGPERLPGVVRSIGFWVGRARRTVNDLKAEFKQELHNADILAREAELQAQFEHMMLGKEPAPDPAPHADPIDAANLALSAHTTERPHDPGH